MPESSTQSIAVAMASNERDVMDIHMVCGTLNCELN
jgi:hypothetical protein